MFVDNMSQIKKNKQIDEMLENANFDYIYILADGRAARLVGGDVRRRLDSRR